MERAALLATHHGRLCLDNGNNDAEEADGTSKNLHDEDLKTAPQQQKDVAMLLLLLLLLLWWLVGVGGGWCWCWWWWCSFVSTRAVRSRYGMCTKIKKGKIL
jgi:hypothetical protein